MKKPPLAMQVRKALQRPELKDVTQESLAHSLGVAFPTFNAWERGRSAPGKDNAELLECLWDLLQTHPPEAIRAILKDAQGSRALLWSKLLQLKTPV